MGHPMQRMGHPIYGRDDVRGEVMKKAVWNLAFYGAVAAAWFVVARARGGAFPAPGDVLRALRAGFADGSLWVAFGASLRRVAIGYAISVVLGVALGVVICSSEFMEQTVGGLLTSLQSLPSVCWLPLAVLWFGSSEKAILFVIVMGSVLSITISMEAGRKQIPAIYSMAGRNLGAHGWKLFAYVLFPAGMPYLVSGLKQGWAFALRGLIAGEMIFATFGLGQQLMAGRGRNDMGLVVAVMLLILALGWMVDFTIFRGLERRMRAKWGLAGA